MPKSKTRRNRRATPARHPAAVKLELVRQRAVATIIDDLDDMIRACDRTNTWDAADDSTRAMNHAACAAVVAHIRRHDLVTMLAKLAGGEMMIIPDQDPTTGTPSGEADNSPLGDDTTSEAPQVLTFERTCACPSSPVRHLPGCPELDAIGQPALDVPRVDRPGADDGEPLRELAAAVQAAAEDPLVWVAIHRTNVPFHALRPDGLTLCGRSTRTGDTMALSTATAVQRPACARCYPVKLDGSQWVRRTPGAQLPDVPEADVPTPFDTSTATLERIRDGLRVPDGAGAHLKAIMDAVPASVAPDAPEPAYTGYRADCHRCGKARVCVTRAGTLYMHGPRGARCHG